MRRSLWHSKDTLVHRLTVVDADADAAAGAEESNTLEEREESLKPSSTRRTLGIE